MADVDDFFEVKVMAGTSYIRRSQIIAVNMFDQTKTSIILTGGTIVTVQESVKDLMKRLRAENAPVAAPATPNAG